MLNLIERYKQINDALDNKDAVTAYKIIKGLSRIDLLSYVDLYLANKNFNFFCKLIKKVD